jgi:hypothetical protein
MCWCFRGYWFVAVSVAVARIYREDLPRVTASRNRLDLSLSKRIRHELVAKINGKRRSRAYEVLGRISEDYSRARRGHYSRARRAPMPIASPRLASPRHATPRPAPPRPGEASERARVFPPFSSPHTCKCIESNPHYK